MAVRRKLTSEEKADAARLAQAWKRYKAAHPQATQEWMSAQCGWKTQGAFFQYLSGIIPLNLKAALKIGAVLGLSVSELSPRLAAMMPPALAEARANYGDGSRRIPLLDHRQALTFASAATRTAAPTIGLDPPLSTAAGTRAFAMLVGDRAMQPDFGLGDVVIVDPDAEPQPGEVVAALIEGEDTVILRRYRFRRAGARKRAPSIELVPLNEDFGSLTLDGDSPGTVIGPVIEHRRLLRRS
jgi:SOS-response transcriptional repressor LexA